MGTLAGPAGGGGSSGGGYSSDPRVAMMQQEQANMFAQLSHLQAIVQQLQHAGEAGSSGVAGTSGAVGPVGASGAASLKSLAGINVLDFHPPMSPSGKVEVSVPDHFGLACHAILLVLQLGLRVDVPADAESLARLQPLEAAMLEARATFLMQLLSHHGEFAGGVSREVLADLPNADFRAWSNHLSAWMIPMCRLSMAPTSFAQFCPPPVHMFAGVHSFATSGGHLIRIFANSCGVRAAGGSRKRRVEDAGGGGSSSGEKRRAGDKERVCFAFRDKGSCRWGAKCRFAHVQGEPAHGTGTGSSTTGGGGGAGRGGGGSGSSAALVVRGRAMAADP
eukprot:g11154.t1